MTSSSPMVTQDDAIARARQRWKTVKGADPTEDDLRGLAHGAGYQGGDLSESGFTSFLDSALPASGAVSHPSGPAHTPVPHPIGPLPPSPHPTPAAPPPTVGGGNGGPLTPTPAPAPAAPVGPTPGAAPIGPLSTQPRQPSAYDQAIRDKLMALLSQDPSNVSLDDPNLVPQMNAYNRQSQRAFDNSRSVMAERMAAEGTNNSGAFDAGLEGLLQARGEGEANFGASLVGQEVQARRQEVMQALQMGQGIMSQDQERQLRRELADLDAQLQREGFGIQREMGQLDAALRREGFDIQKLLGLGDLDVRRTATGNQYDLGLGQLALQRLLGEQGNGLGLLQILLGDRQFNDKLGVDIGQWANEFQRKNFFDLLG